jgi:hypothetical protein
VVQQLSEVYMATFHVVLVLAVVMQTQRAEVEHKC